MAFTTDFSGDYEDALQRYSTTTLKRAEDIANQPYTPYTGERIAGRSEQELANIEQLRNLASSGLGSQQVQQASDIMSNLGSYEAGTYDPRMMQDVNIASYMNPYLQGALDPTIRNIKEQQTAALQGIQGQAGRAGAFGGSRHGVLEAEAMKGYGQNISDVIAQGYANAFNTATGLAESDLDRYNQAQLIREQMRQSAADTQARGAAGLSQVANQMREQGYSDMEIQRALDQEERAMRQAQLDIPYQEFQREQAFPYQQLQAALAPLGYGAQVATAAPTVDEPSYLQNLLGGVGYTANILGNLGKAGISYGDVSSGVSDLWSDVKSWF